MQDRGRAPMAVTLAVGSTASLVTVTLLPLLAGSASTAGRAAVLVAVLVAATWNAGLVAAPILAGISWLLFNGFVESASGQLHWYPDDPGWLLCLLLATTAMPSVRWLGEGECRPLAALRARTPAVGVAEKPAAELPRVSCRPGYGRLSARSAGSVRTMPAVGRPQRVIRWRAPLVPCPRSCDDATVPPAGARVAHTGSVVHGQLRIYLGAAPGVGKTYAMLAEGQRRAARGADVVVAAVDTRRRPGTAAVLTGLPCVPDRQPAAAQLDLGAVLRRRPEVALVDDLARPNPAGSRHAARWQDVDELLAAGISVIGTVNVTDVESLRDVTAAITGNPPAATVPDAFLHRADRLELIDVAPDALRQRLADGQIYGAGEVDAALASYFRLGTLTALRELSLSWLAGTVDRALLRYRTEHDVEGVWETRERVVVALSGGPEGERLTRRAARLTARSGGDLLAVHVTRWDGGESTAAALASQRALVESLGGTFHQVVGEDIPAGIVRFAGAENATQIVVGAAHRSRLRTMVAGTGMAARTQDLAGPIDVHLVSGASTPATSALPALSRGVTQRRQLVGVVTGALVLLLLTFAVTNLRSGLNLPSEMLLYLLATVFVALIGGIYPALSVAVAGSLLLNWYCTPPFHTFKIEDRNNALALLVFVAVAASVSTVVDLAARRSSLAARATAEADTLTVLAGSVLRGDDALPALLDRLRESFGLRGVSLLHRAGSDERAAGWAPVASSGPPPSGEPAADSTVLPVGDEHRLVLHGRPLSPEDLRLVGAFAAQAAVVLDRRRLAEAAEAAKPLAAADRVRTALLTAVSHDLRTPLASAIAAVSSLRSRDIAWTGEERSELLATADESLARLARLVENLLDMSRLQAGAMSVFPRPTALEDVVPVALDSLGSIGRHITVDVPATLPPVLADPALLERVIANLAANAVRHAPDAGVPPCVAASALGDRIELRIIDRGPGIPAGSRERVFAPFQRLGDNHNAAGVGLGLALARGLAEAMGGTVTPEDTPAGGLTMVVSLPAATAAPGPDFLAAAARERERQ